jgi:hypothetical protein
MDFSEKGLKSLSDKDFRHFQKVKLQPVQSINSPLSWMANPYFLSKSSSRDRKVG